MKKLASIFLLLALLCSCGELGIQTPDPDSTQEPGKEEPSTQEPEKPLDRYGLEYMFGSATNTVPEVHVDVAKDQWQKLLSLYDGNPKTKQYVVCNVDLVLAGEHHKIQGAGLRLRGNTSRRRPQDWNGYYHHAHFGINFRKYSKDSAHEIKGLRKINLKWFKDDPNYAREMYCYDLFRRAGVWTAINTRYCRLWLTVGGKELYYGVYEMQEAVDMRYVKAREELFGGAGGNLWKCRWGADLKNQGMSFGLDDGSDAEFVYECKSDDNDYAAAEEQLRDFMLKLNGKSDESFHKWIQEVCDVPLLLRTYAVNVVCGMWDDYWSNTNNYYLYFNSTDKYNYKFFFIPYDYDNTLGTSSMMDSGRQDPCKWGPSDRPLIYRLLRFEDFRKIYMDELKRLVGEDNGLFWYKASINRIKGWQSLIRDYVANDTGEDCSIYDAPAAWGNHPEYRLLTEDPSTNFFMVKAASIEKL